MSQKVFSINYTVWFVLNGHHYTYLSIVCKYIEISFFYPDEKKRKTKEKKSSYKFINGKKLSNVTLTCNLMGVNII